MISTNNIRGKLRENQILAPYTSWKIGGPAQYFFEPADLEDLQEFLRQCSTLEEVPITVLGAGTNVLIRDNGIRGVVIYLRNHLNSLQQLDDFTLRVAVGVTSARLMQHCIHQGFADAAFLAGIPGTVGGLLAMNAGTADGNIWDHVLQVETIKRDGMITYRDAKEFQATYRHVTGLAHDEWFIAAKLLFAKQDGAIAQQTAQAILRKRSASQPLTKPSCGSVFCNPPGQYAARLIEAAGLKGTRIGAAVVSAKHANFILNEGNATARDVELLIQHIVKVVKQSQHIELTPEVRILGEI
jgi:UDP-N-acetylmuramate dehydrogenase